MNLATFSFLFVEVLILGTVICDLKLEWLVREDIFVLFYPAYLNTKIKHIHCTLVFSPKNISQMNYVSLNQWVSHSEHLI